MFSNLKPISIFNFSIAAVAFLLSVYTFTTNQIQAWSLRQEAEKRMQFGGYTLGYDYMHLVLCTEPDAYAKCVHKTTNRDFAKLEPTSAVLLQSAVDWPALSGSDQIEAPWAANTDILGRATLVNDALTARYEDNRVSKAFRVGETVALLFDLADNPATMHDLTRYGALANATNDAVKDLGVCRGYLSPDDPKSGDAKKKLKVALPDVHYLDACLRSDQGWGPPNS